MSELTMIKGKFEKIFGAEWAIYVSEDTMYKIYYIDKEGMDDHGLNYWARKNKIIVKKDTKLKNISVKLDKSGEGEYYIDGQRYVDVVLDKISQIGKKGSQKKGNGINIIDKKVKVEKIKTTIAKAKPEKIKDKEEKKLDPVIKKIIKEVDPVKKTEQKTLKKEIKGESENKHFIQKTIKKEPDVVVATVESKANKLLITTNKKAIKANNKGHKNIVKALTDIDVLIKNHEVKTKKSSSINEDKMKSMQEIFNKKLVLVKDDILNVAQLAIETNKKLEEMNTSIVNIVEEQGKNIQQNNNKAVADRVELVEKLSGMVTELKEGDSLRSDKIGLVVSTITGTIKKLEKIGAFADGTDMAKNVAKNIAVSYNELRKIYLGTEEKISKDVLQIGYKYKAVRKDIDFLNTLVNKKFDKLDNTVLYKYQDILNRNRVTGLKINELNERMKLKISIILKDIESGNKLSKDNNNLLIEARKILLDSKNERKEISVNIIKKTDDILEIVNSNGRKLKENYIKQNSNSGNILKLVGMAEYKIIKKVESGISGANDNKDEIRDLISTLEQKVELQNRMITDIKKDNNFFKKYDKKPNSAIRMLIGTLFSIEEAEGITIMDSFDGSAKERVIDIHIKKMILKHADINGLNEILNHNLRFVFDDDGIKRVGGIIGTSSIRFLLNKWYFEEYKALNKGEDIDGFKEVTRDVVATFRIPGKIHAKAVSKINKTRKIYKKYCYSCHESGFGGATSKDNFEYWDEFKQTYSRKETIRTVYEGIGKMPQKGMCYDCTNTELIDAIDWLIGDYKPKSE